MKFAKEDLLLYAVTDRSWLKGKTLYEQVEQALQGGATFLQLREKELDEAHFMEEAAEIQKLCSQYQVPFLINDNVDIALAMGADGVHVGQEDMEAGEARRKLGPDKIIGVSAHSFIRQNSNSINSKSSLYAFNGQGDTYRQPPKSST